MSELKDSGNKKVITVQDCEELYAKFKKYTETAEQHEFPTLAMINMKLDTTMLKIHALNAVPDQKDTRAMFRVVLKLIGCDASEYQEEVENVAT